MEFIKPAQMCDDEPFIVLNGDTLFDIDLFQFKYLFEISNADMIIGLKAMENFNRYGVVQLADDERVIGFKEKEFQKEGLINGGVYIFAKKNL